MKCAYLENLSTTWRRLEAEAARSGRGNEGVRVLRIHEGLKGGVGDGGGQVHRVRRLDAGKAMERDLQVVGGVRLQLGGT